MILLEPELEDGIDEGVDVSVSLYDVLFGQRLLIPADGLWCAKRISSVDVLCIEMAFSVGDSDQHVDLGNGETINVMLISPRRWGKSSLVKMAMEELRNEDHPAR